MSTWTAEVVAAGTIVVEAKYWMVRQRLFFVAMRLCDAPSVLAKNLRGTCEKVTHTFDPHLATDCHFCPDACFVGTWVNRRLKLDAN